MKASLMSMFLTFAANGEKPALFPFPFKFHLILAAVSVLFFLISFARYKKPYQVIFTIAVPFSLLIWKAEGNRTLYYAIAVIEAVLILAALVSAFIFKSKNEEDDDESAQEE